MCLEDHTRRYDDQESVQHNYCCGTGDWSFQYVPECRTDLPMRERQTGEIDQCVSSLLAQDTTRSHIPVIISGSVVHHPETSQPPPGRHIFVPICIAIMLIGILLSTLMTFVPIGVGDAFVAGSFFVPSLSNITFTNNKGILIASQAATATEITRDGYEYNGAGGQYTWAGVPKHFILPDHTTTDGVPANTTPAQAIGQMATQQSPPVIGRNEGHTATGATSMHTASGVSSQSGQIADSSFTNPFTPGQCTYWADYEYHHLTGYAIPWRGDAGDWTSGAAAAGWIISSVPHVPSIVVLRSGIQGAGWSGHVAVVEKMNFDGSVDTTNWNVTGWGVFSWQTYYPGSGVSFIWHP
jgi:surface antigen